MSTFTTEVGILTGMLCGVVIYHTELGILQPEMDL